jgi:hypothetical protein
MSGLWLDSGLTDTRPDSMHPLTAITSKLALQLIPAHCDIVENEKKLNLPKYEYAFNNHTLH